MKDDEKKGVRVLAMGEPVPIEAERFNLMINVQLDNEKDARHLAGHLAHIFQILKLEGEIMVVGSTLTMQPEKPPA